MWLFDLQRKKYVPLRWATEVINSDRNYVITMDKFNIPTFSQGTKFLVWEGRIILTKLGLEKILEGDIIDKKISDFVQNIIDELLEGWEFIPEKDFWGSDIEQLNPNLLNLIWHANKNSKCVAFNTLGYLKHTYFEKALINLQNQGIYVRAKKLKVAFHDNQLCERGTTVAIYDYAYWNKHFLNNDSIILYSLNSPNNFPEVVDFFAKEFKVFGYSDWSEVDLILGKEEVDVLYTIKSGEFDQKISNKVKTVVHCVFNCFQPHGDIYSSIHRLIYGNDGKYPAVPHMINLPDTDEDMREKLGIPKDVTVLGRYGGFDDFSIKQVKEVVWDVANKNPDIWFLFANTRPFCPTLKNIIHLDKIIDRKEKVKFINTCDGMLWARIDGESFGLSIGEFSSKNKPVIACNIGYPVHIDLLKDKAMIYNDEKSLIYILTHFKEIKATKEDWNAYRDYEPEQVMKIFHDVYLKHNFRYKDMNNSIIPKKSNNPETVIVTAFYDIGRSNWTNFQRSTDVYINAFKKYLLLDNKIILFMDDRYLDQIPKSDKLTIIPINEAWLLKNTLFWNMVKEDKEIIDSEKYKQLIRHRRHHPENFSSEYNFINHCKIEFIKFAINNLIGDEFIVWSDFGYVNSILKEKDLFFFNKLNVTHLNPNKLNFFLLNKIQDSDFDPIQTLKEARTTFTGSLFAGNKKNMLLLWDLYLNVLKEFKDLGISDDDQHIYLRCLKQKPEIFELFKSNEPWPKALLWLQEPLDRIRLMEKIFKSFKFEIGVEIGTDEGSFANKILASSALKLYCVDPYLKYNDYNDAINNKTGDDLYYKIKQILQSNWPDRVDFIRDFSENAAKVFDNESLDFVYIDGNHQYEYVINDLLSWFNKVKVGGIIMGDDVCDLDKTPDSQNNVFIEWSPGCFGKYGVGRALINFCNWFNFPYHICGDQFIIFKERSVPYMENFKYYPRMDHHGDDIGHQQVNIETLFNLATKMPDCVAFNNLGYLKHHADKIIPLNEFKPTDGLFVKK